jgi:two-component system capsular synthesis response regulator RcsB
MKIVVADDHPLILFGLECTLKRLGGVELSATARNSTELIEKLNAHRPDILITDFSMPGGSHGDGVLLLGYLLRNYPKLRIIVLTMMTSPSMQEQILDTGVHALVLKSDQETELELALASIERGQRYISTHAAILEKKAADQQESGAPAKPALSERELEVLRLYVNGMTVSGIANSLCRSVKTISKQKQAAMSKLGVSNERELFEYAKTSGLL